MPSNPAEHFYRNIMLIRITAPHFVAGYDMTNENIAPIIKYMKGWNFNKISNYCNIKGWKLEYYA